MLTERYGEFFIAELIGAQDERNRALVAEVDGHANPNPNLTLTLALTPTLTLTQVDGHAVGLMATSSDIEVGLLRDCFELEAYDGLVRPDEEALALLKQARKQAKAEAAELEAQRKEAAAAAAEEGGEEAAAEAAAEAEAAAAAAEAAAAAAEAEAEAAEAAERPMVLLSDCRVYPSSWAA